MGNKVILLVLCLSLALFSLTVGGDVNAYDPKYDWLKDYADKEKAEEYADDMSEQDEESFKLLLEFWMDYAEELLGDEELTDEEKAQAQGLVKLLEALADKTSDLELKGKLLAMVNELQNRIREEFVEALLAYIEEIISGDKLTYEEKEQIVSAAYAIANCAFFGDCDYTEEAQEAISKLFDIIGAPIGELTDEKLAKAKALYLLVMNQMSEIYQEIEWDGDWSEEEKEKFNTTKDLQTIATRLWKKIEYLEEKKAEAQAEFLKKYGGYGKWVLVRKYPKVTKTSDYLPWWRLKLLEDLASGGNEDEEEAEQEGEKGGKEYGLDQLKELRRTGMEIRRIGRMIGEGRPINEIEDAWETFVKDEFWYNGSDDGKLQDDWEPFEKGADAGAIMSAINGVLQEAIQEALRNAQHAGGTHLEKPVIEHAGGVHIGEIAKMLYDTVVAIRGKDLPSDWYRVKAETALELPKITAPPLAIEKQKLPTIKPPKATEMPKTVERPRPVEVPRPPAVERPPAVTGPAEAPRRPEAGGTSGPSGGRR